jgi:hypothetical protein
MRETRKRQVALAAPVIATVIGLAVVLVLMATRRGPSPEPDLAAPYVRVRSGMPEADALAAVGVPPRPAEGSGRTDRGPVRLVAEDGTAHFPNAAVTPVDREDGSVLYKWDADGQVAGWARWWDTRRHTLVVVFGPDGTVIGRTPYEDTTAVAGR